MGILIGIGANVQPAINEINKLKTGVSSLGDTIETLRAKLLARKEFINTTTDVKQVAILNGEIKELEAEILRVKSIGNQGGADAFSKLTDGASNAFSAIRRLAFILPGIGIAGLFDAAFSSLQKFITALEGVDVPKFKDLQDSIAGAKDEFVKATVTVNELRNEIEAAKNGFISKEGVVKHYNETIGKTTGLVKNLDEAEKGLGANADAYIRFTLLKAAANVALSKSADVAFQAALQNQKDLERISKITTGDKEGIGEFIKSGEDNLRKAEQESFQKRVTSLNDIAKNFLSEAEAISKQFNFNFFQDTKPEKAVKEKVEKVNKELKNVEFEVPIVPVVGSLIKAKATFQDFVKDLNKGIELPKIDVPITPGIQKRIDQIIEAKQEALKLAQTIQGVLTPAFESVFEAIQSHQNVFKAFFKSLEQAVAQMISKFIAAAAAAEVVSLILGGGGGGFTGIFSKLIGGGGGIGAAFSPFAKGGIVTGPTLGLVGEAGPEVIMPLDKLKGMLGGLTGSQAVVVTGKISGNDILLSNARTTRTQGRGG